MRNSHAATQRRTFWAVLPLSMALTGGGAQAAGLKLSLRDAVEMALAQGGNAKVEIGSESIRIAEARAAQSRAALLPSLEGSVGQDRQTRNLEAFGLTPSGLFRPPKLVGPFSTFDARAQLQQSILDFSSIRRLQASKRGVLAAQAEKDEIEETTAAEVARLYLQALKNREALAAAQADVDLAEALLDLARDRMQAGTGVRIEETRAGVQLAARRQDLLVAQNRYGNSLLLLLRAIGSEFDPSVELTDRLSDEIPAAPGLDQAIAQAYENRPDLAAQTEKERQAEKLYSAAKLQRLPSVSGFADYGTIGTKPSNPIPTWTAGVSLRLPVFEGGRIEADKAEAAARLRQERIRSRDLRRQIELEVRLALQRWELSSRQLEVARQGLELAEQELAQAQRRYQSGVTGSIEVTDAQTRLENARQSRVAALFEFNSAQTDLAEAQGSVRQWIEERAK